MYSQAEQKIRIEITKFIQSEIGKRPIDINYPPKIEWGNFTVPCFNLVKGKAPADIAKDLAGKFDAKKYKLLKYARAIGPYINIFIDQNKFNELVLSQVLKEKEKFGNTKIGQGKKIMVEYFSPNTNKPLTVGHLRNICLGESISKILKAQGYKVVTSCLYNDRGIALCKTIVAYQKWAKNKKPGNKIKSDHFAGDYYVMFNKKAKDNPELEKEAKECLLKWEAGDKNIKELWQKIINWTLAGFDETLKNIEAEKFDKKYYESKIYTKGKDIILAGLKKGVFKKHKEGYIYAPLDKHGLADKILLRSDGTSLYIVQDIYLASLKNKSKLDKSIYVVGSEQDLAMKQLFKILELLGEKYENYHLTYGMMRLPDGKIKSREGLVKGTGADDLVSQLDAMAEEEVKKRNKKLSKTAIKSRSHKISLAALKYYILEVNPKSTMVFDPKKSLAFTGKTGPYLQYVYARISSILKKVKTTSIDASPHFPTVKGGTNKGESDSFLNAREEKELISILSKFPVAINDSAENYDPSQLTSYLYDLAKSFSAFYESVPIIKADVKTRQARLALIKSVKIVMERGLGLLGIKAIERM